MKELRPGSEPAFDRSAQDRIKRGFQPAFCGAPCRLKCIAGSEIALDWDVLESPSIRDRAIFFARPRSGQKVREFRGFHPYIQVFW
jgi:hypothetical protein